MLKHIWGQCYKTLKH